MIKTIIYWETMGYTQKALKALRDELSERANNKVEVYEYQSNDITCGFLLADFTTKELIMIGDGFRTDKGGEGGAGYNTAQAIFSIFGISPMSIEVPPPHIPYSESEEEMIAAQTAYASELEEKVEWIWNDEPQAALKDRNPQYIRN